MTWLAPLGFWAALFLVLYIAVQDFLRLKVRNLAVLALIGCYALFATGLSTAVVIGDLAAGLLLFVLSFGFWMAGMMGGGDAKLALPLGFLVGWHGLAGYTVLLLVFAAGFMLALRLGNCWLRGRGLVGRRLSVILGSQKVPYAVPMGLSAWIVIALRGV